MKWSGHAQTKTNAVALRILDHKFKGRQNSEKDNVRICWKITIFILYKSCSFYKVNIAGKNFG